MSVHSAPVTPGQRQEARERLYTAVRQVRATGRATCACCGRADLDPVWQAYRCYYCGLWFCLACCPEHFGGPRGIDVPIRAG